MNRVRLPRALHPGAWWLWAIGMATAASRTTNPLLLALIISVVSLVVSVRRSDAAWARGFAVYLWLGLIVIGVRVVFRILFDAQYGAHVLVTLPEVPLPDAVAGIRIGGPVSLEGVLAAVYDGLRLATLLICIGAANVLANAKRLLKSLPAALHEIGVAVTVALTVAPQLIESGQRVHRARRLRGERGRRMHVVRMVVIPVLTDALDRSLLLAAAMDSRGYGRSAAVPRLLRTVTSFLVIGGLIGVCIGTYGLLDGTAPNWIGVPVLLVGIAAAVVGVALGGRRVVRTHYRPDPWRAPEWAVACSGVATAATFIVANAVDPAQMAPSVQPLTWPTLPLLPAVGALLGSLPAWLAPPVASPRSDSTATGPPAAAPSREPAVVG
jgi:energy-coupling factor transport system permease protein